MEKHLKQRYDIYLDQAHHTWAVERAGHRKFSHYLTRLIARDWAESLTGDLGEPELNALPEEVAQAYLRGLERRRHAADAARKPKARK